MEINTLSTFLEVANLKSFSKAAKKIGYAQSTVTMQIQSLEKELNTKLFDRLNKSIKLTDSGKILQAYARDIISKTVEAEQVITNRDFVGGELNIGVFESICGAFFPILLSEYRKLYPKVTINIYTASFKELESMLNSNQIDILWFYGYSRNNDCWIKVYEKKYPLSIISSYLHPLAKFDNIDIEALKSEKFVIADKYCGYREIIDEKLRRHNFQIDVSIELDNSEIIRKFIIADLGLGILPYFTVKYDIAKKRLAKLNIKELEVDLCSQIFYHKSKWLTPTMKTFLEFSINSDVLN